MQEETSSQVGYVLKDENPTTENFALKPGYVVQVADNKTYLVPAVLAQEKSSLAAVLMPDLSATLEEDGGVSDLIMFSYNSFHHAYIFSNC